MSAALWLVRILRKIPHSWAFDKHLTDCAALEVLYRPFNGAEPLKVAHVLKFEPLPDFHPWMSEPQPSPIAFGETVH